ncbi:unnamed protein product [Gordionus sp. m RMFG-2023]|uniref:vacuolar protein sorting-associated protein 11 homolog isoform X2 n=1 Tax=Gordionus sp. m RMFG-2023 TaxID=3053472 RepID=UPI0030E54A27
MSFLQWRRFNFFDKDILKDPDKNESYDKLKDINISTSTSIKGYIVFGDYDGFLHFMTQDLEIKSLKAHDVKVEHLYNMTNSQILISVGYDNDSPQPIIKIWNLTKGFDRYGNIPYLKSFKITYGNKTPIVNCVTAHENLTLLIIGLNSGQILMYKGNLTKGEKNSLSSIKPKLFHQATSPITNLALSYTQGYHIQESSKKDPMVSKTKYNVPSAFIPIINKIPSSNNNVTASPIDTSVMDQLNPISQSRSLDNKTSTDSESLRHPSFQIPNAPPKKLAKVFKTTLFISTLDSIMCFSVEDSHLSLIFSSKYQESALSHLVKHTILDSVKGCDHDCATLMPIFTSKSPRARKISKQRSIAVASDDVLKSDVLVSSSPKDSVIPRQPSIGSDLSSEKWSANLLSEPPKNKFTPSLDGKSLDWKEELGIERIDGNDERQEETEEFLVVARNEALYFYNSECLGPCLAFESQKRYYVQYLPRSRYLVTVENKGDDLDRGKNIDILTVYDVHNKFVAFSCPVPGFVAMYTEPVKLVNMPRSTSYLVLTRSPEGGGYSLLTLTEKSLSYKLETLFRKNLYNLALGLARNFTSPASKIAQNGGDDGNDNYQNNSVLANIFKLYGDHLYSKSDYENAINQYRKTLTLIMSGRKEAKNAGFKTYLEPSYVIRKYLKASQIKLLTFYLEDYLKLYFTHRLNLTTAGNAKEEDNCGESDDVWCEDLIELLINCYVKSGESAKLDKFLESFLTLHTNITSASNRRPAKTAALKDDGHHLERQNSGNNRDREGSVEDPVKSKANEDNEVINVIVRVLGSRTEDVYRKRASNLALMYGLTQTYLKIEIEDNKNYSKALEYIKTVTEPEEVYLVIKNYGKLLLEQDSTATIDILIRLCRNSEDTIGKASSVIKPEDFLYLFLNEGDDKLSYFLENVISASENCDAVNSKKNSEEMVDQVVYNTLLELYMAELPHQLDPLLAKKKQRQITDIIFGQPPAYDIDRALIECQKQLITARAAALHRKQNGLQDDNNNAEFFAHLTRYLCENKSACSVPPGSYNQMDGKNVIDKHDDWKETLKKALHVDRDRQNSVDIPLQNKRVAKSLQSIHHSAIEVLRFLNARSNGKLQFSAFQDFITEQFESNQKDIDRLQKIIKESTERIERNETIIQDLANKPQIFQVNKCGACAHAIDTPAVYFLCKHGFHQNCYDSYSSNIDLSRSISFDLKNANNPFASSSNPYATNFNNNHYKNLTNFTIKDNNDNISTTNNNASHNLSVPPGCPICESSESDWKLFRKLSRLKESGVNERQLNRNKYDENFHRQLEKCRLLRDKPDGFSRPASDTNNTNAIGSNIGKDSAEYANFNETTSVFGLLSKYLGQDLFERVELVTDDDIPVPTVDKNRIDGGNKRLSSGPSSKSRIHYNPFPID